MIQTKLTKMTRILNVRATEKYFIVLTKSLGGALNLMFERLTNMCQYCITSFRSSKFEQKLTRKLTIWDFQALKGSYCFLSVISKIAFIALVTALYPF